MQVRHRETGRCLLLVIGIFDTGLVAARGIAQHGFVERIQPVQFSFGGEDMMIQH